MGVVVEGSVGAVGLLPVAGLGTAECHVYLLEARAGLAVVVAVVVALEVAVVVESGEELGLVGAVVGGVGVGEGLGEAALGCAACVDVVWVVVEVLCKAGVGWGCCDWWDCCLGWY